MKLAIMSDVHLEFGELPVENLHGCDVLVLAGDILVARTLEQLTAEPHTDAYKLRNRYVQFVEQCVSEFKHVVAIAGNHEFYGGKFVQSVGTLRKFYGELGVHYFECDVLELEGYKFCGCTMWTDFNNDPLVAWDAKRFINDFQRIVDDSEAHYTKLRTESVQKRHQQSVNWLNSVVDHSTIVVTHMAPHEQSVHPRFKGDQLSHYYYVDMSRLICNNQPQLWIHGHMHNCSDYQLYNTRVICNPRGYVGYETTEGYRYKVIEL